MKSKAQNGVEILPRQIQRLCRGCVLALLLAGVGRAAEPVILENAALRVELGTQGELCVQDKRTGRTWRQVVVNPASMAAGAPCISGEEIQFPLHFDGLPRSGGPRRGVLFQASVKLSGIDELVAEFKPSAEAASGEWTEVRYPLAFLPPSGADPSLLFPHGEGLLIPANNKHPDFLKFQPGQLYGGTRSYLNCVGSLEMQSGAGLLAIPLPFESADVYWPELQGGIPGAVGIQHGWRANRYKLDRPMSLRWQFTSQGGYVAMAKGYRRWCGPQRWRKTLRQKLLENPNVDKLLGAPVVWGFGSVPELGQLVDGLRAAGVDRCELGLEQRLFDCMVEPTPEQQSQRRELVEKASAAGFLVHHYDNYRDTFEKNPKLIAWNQVNWDAYPQDGVVRENGELLSPGFQIDGHRVPCGVITPGAFMKYAQKHLPRDLKRYPWTSRFIDCVGSCAFDEGVDWHPDRPEATYYFTRQQREKLMAYSNELGQITGTECGMDYLIPNVHWFDGAMHLVCFMDMPSGTFGLQVTDADGSLKGRTLVQGDLDASGKPYPVSESIKYRIPFWSLVHHDDAVVTWRWENGMQSPMTFWTRKLLLNLLHGTPPMYGLGTDGKFVQTYRQAIARTHQLASPWGRRVGYDEMLSHRFVTADRLVQETRFANGLGICVNFGRTPFKVTPEVEIPAEGYGIFSDAADRVFEAPVAVKIEALLPQTKK